MEIPHIPRREFLQKISAGAAFLTALSSIQSTYADQLFALDSNSDEPGTFASLRSQYLLSPDVTYFNHGSIGTIPKIVHEAHTEYLRLCESNPWYYMWSEPWEEARAKTREKVAAFLGVNASEIAFTHNTTEGFNLLANGLPLGKGDEVLFSTLNHSGASKCWFHYATSRGFSVKQFEFPIREVAGLSQADIVEIYARQISENTRVLVLPHIDNLVGLRHPVKELAAMARSKGVEFVAVDGAQSVGMISVNIAGLGVDFYAMSPHKWLQSPKGTGLLYIRKSVQSQLRPMWVTWGQKTWEGTVRIFEDYGTRNLAEVLTLGNAIDFQQQLGIEKTEQRRKTLWRHFANAVEAAPNIAWQSPKNWELGASLFSIEVNGQSSKEIFRKLFPKHGFVFRAFDNPGWKTMRISPNIYNTESEIDRFVKLLES